MNRTSNIGVGNNVHFTVHDIINAVVKQKGKSRGSDGVSMEAIINGDIKLHIHLAIIFNLFIKFRYLPSTFMHSVILPLVKCRSGDLNDVNNYRANAISTATSKVFETLFLTRLLDETGNDMYQFGFKAGHSTTLCTSAFKRTIRVSMKRVQSYK